MELHIPPQMLHGQMSRLSGLDTPLLERLWAKYAKSPQRLSRGVKLLRQMKGFGQADVFYDGVEANETFERDFRPIADYPDLKPVMLILILDLYFRLTPGTMVVETPEVVELARLMRVNPDEVVGVMECYQHCDPYLKRKEKSGEGKEKRLLTECEQIWARFGNGRPEELSALAVQMKEYFK